MGAQTPVPLLGLTVLSKELITAPTSAVTNTDPHKQCLSVADLVMLCVGAFGACTVHTETLAVPHLKTALVATLTKFPWFAGRLAHTKGGASVDLACSNEGLQLVVASSSSTLPLLLEQLRLPPQSPLGAAKTVTNQPAGPWPELENPFMEYYPPIDVSKLVNDKCPLALACVVQLSGGGSLLWLCAHHVLADFHTLQLFASCCAQQYRTVLQQRASLQPPRVTSAAPPAQPCVSMRAEDTEQPCVSMRAEDTEQPCVSMWAEDTERWADAGAGVGHPPRQEFAVGGPLTVPRILFNIVYHLLLRGGGVQTRLLQVSSDRLAQLKRQATQELAQERQQLQAHAHARARAAPADGNAAGGPACCSRGDGDEDDEDDALLGVDFASTNDALIARIMQALHALPTRRHASPTLLFMTANMRKRPELGLGPGLLGNVSYAARVAVQRPSEGSLGRVAGLVRHSLASHLVPQYKSYLARTAAAFSRCKPGGVVFQFLVDPHMPANIFPPEGCINATRWDVEYEAWQFGSSPPVALFPCGKLGPSVFIVYPAPPAYAVSGGGVMVKASTHARTWRQWDAACVTI